MGGVEIVEVEEGYIIAVRLGSYGLNDVLLVEWFEDEGKVVRIQEEIRQVLYSNLRMSVNRCLISY